MAKVLIISGSERDKKHVNAIGDALKRFDTEYEWHVGSAHKQHGNVEEYVIGYNNERLPLITVAGRSDALSGCSAYMSDNPVIASRPDWKDPKSLKLYFFSTVGTPSFVAPGAVLGPEQTAGYINKLLTLKERKPADSSVPFIGPENDVTKKFVQALEDIGAGLKARKSDYKEIGDAPVCMLFRYRNEEKAIDKVLAETESPVILSPLEAKKEQIIGQTFGSFERGYNSAVAMVLDPSNAALFAATIISLYDDSVRTAVSRYKSRSKQK